MHRYAPLAALVLLGACTSPGDAGDAGAISGRAGSLALVRIERATLEDPDVAASRAVLGAAVARYSGLEGHDVVELLGGRGAPTETCSLGEDAAAFASPGAAVELLDAGDLEVRVAGTRTLLLPRTFPDLAGLVGGAFYAEDALLGVAVADVDEYAVQASGSAEVAPFEVLVRSPSGFEEILVDGVAAVDGLSLERGAGLEVIWDAGDPRDRVEIDVAASGAVLGCVASDDGAFRVPASALASVGADSAARLVLRRVRTQPFDVEGVDAAWVSVAASRTLRVVLR